MCGRVLAGFDSIYSGGMCPTISAIPSIDHIDFNRLTLELFIGVNVPTNLLLMLACSLVRHHFEYGEKFGRDSLITRVESVAHRLQVEHKLKPWSEALSERFALDNQLFSPVTINDGSSIVSVISNLVDGMNVLQRSVNHVIKFNATQERLNAEVVNSMHRLEENQVDILNQIQDYRDATISTARYSNNQMIRRKQGRQSTMDQSIAVATPTTPTKPLISSISSMSELFYNWYLFKMYNFEPADKFERGKLKKLSKFIMYLRSFSTTPMLQERPSDDDSDAKRRWVISLQSESIQAQQEKLLAFLDAYFKQRTGKGLSKCTMHKLQCGPLKSFLKKCQ